MTSGSSRTHVITGTILLLGALMQLVFWSHQWLYGDQYGLLLPALQLLETGELAPFSKTMSGGGRIPGGFLQVIIAGPLALWRDFRAPSLGMALGHVVAVAVLLWVMVSAFGSRIAPTFAAVYWLSPWRLYHAGFLWEPGFVLLPAALHMGCCWMMRPQPDGDTEPAGPGISAVGASLLLGAILVTTLQIHASFVVLVIATALLWWRGGIRVNYPAIFAGGAIGALTLLPTASAWWNDALPRIAPQIDQRVSLPVLAVSNAGKAFLYFLRMGSADIGRRLRQTAWLDDTPAGTEAPFDLPAILVSSVSVISVVSIVVAIAGFVWMYRRYARTPATELAGDAGAWVGTYALSVAAALVVAGGISPIPVQSWHVLIAFHAACIPTALWLAGAFECSDWRRPLAFTFVCLLVITSLLVGVGHPTYLRPNPEQVERQDLTPELRAIIPPASR